MTARPRISVIVPGKDVEDYVSDTLTSLTRQVEDVRDLEVVVVDDGSSDSTGEVVASFADRLPHLTAITNREPVGPATARNQGLAATTGRYVAYLDADDWLAPGHLGTLADALDELRVDFLRVDHTTVTGRRRTLTRAPQAVRGVARDPRESILPTDDRTMVDYPYAWAGMFDRALATDGLLTFPEGLRTAEDRPWIWRLFLEARSYAVVDAPGICYRRGLTDSLSQTFDARQLDVIPALHATLDVVADAPDTEIFEPKLARTAVALLSHHLRRSSHMPAGAREELRAGAREILARIPDDVLAYETNRTHPGRVWVLHGLLPRPRGALRYQPPASVATPPPLTPPVPAGDAVELVVAAGPDDLADAAVVLEQTGPALVPPTERVLVVAGDDPAGLGDDEAGLRVDRVVRLAQLTAPRSPADWAPGTDALPMTERLLRHAWGLGDRPVHLLVPDLGRGPGATLADVLHDAPITLYAAGPDAAARLPLQPLARRQRIAAVHRGTTTQHAPEDDRLARLRAYLASPDALPWLRAEAQQTVRDVDGTAGTRFDAGRAAELGLPADARLSPRVRLRRAVRVAARHPLTGRALETSGLLRVLDRLRGR